MHDPQRAGPEDDQLTRNARDHLLQNVVGAARLQLDLLRRRLDRGQSDRDDVAHRLDDVRATLDKAIEMSNEQ